MEHNQIDILDREERIFKSIQATIDLMESSPCKEVRDTQATLGFLLDEYEQSRNAIIALITLKNSQSQDGE